MDFGVWIGSNVYNMDTIMFFSDIRIVVTMVTELFEIGLKS